MKKRYKAILISMILAGLATAGSNPVVVEFVSIVLDKVIPSAQASGSPLPAKASAGPHLPGSSWECVWIRMSSVVDLGSTGVYYSAPYPSRGYYCGRQCHREVSFV